MDSTSRKDIQSKVDEVSQRREYNENKNSIEQSANNVDSVS